MKIGDGEILFLGHSGFIVKVNQKIIAIDPYRISDNVPKADIVLITHSHNDHCSIRDIQKISKNGTIVLCPVDCQSALMKVKNVDVHIVGRNEILDFRNFKIECVSAYTNNKHHPNSEGWLGYLIKFKKNVIYFSGDTDLTEDVKNLSGYGKKDNNFVAVLPVSGTVAMDSFSAYLAAKILGTSIVIPHGFGAGVYGKQEDALNFVELCKQNNIDALILDKI
jgi:L-ascorbate metabolism protein UlaG (beta-lactamase superfamily)